MTKDHAIFCIILIMLGTFGCSEVHFEHKGLLSTLSCCIPILMGVGGILEKCD
jgi:hypothetical protein